MSIQTEDKSTILQNVKLHEKDTGSSEVQVALLTDRIRYLTEHFKEHKKDLHSKRGLQNLVNRRKKLLRYLKCQNNASYFSLIGKLGLRDSY
jgi:small subunit ribosomal protein S15